MGNTYVVDIYAIWDEDPVFTISSNTFYEGKDVGVDDIKKGIRATDFEDGDLTGSIRIVEIRYSSGKRVDGKVLDSYSKYTPSGMGSGDRFDTWFECLDKELGSVIHDVVSEVTDSAGVTVKGVGKVIVRYNEIPKVTSRDAYFTVDEANRGMITEQGLLSKYVSVSDVEEGRSIKSSLKFDYFSSKEIREISDSTDIVLNCSVWDTYGPNGVGKKVVKSW